MTISASVTGALSEFEPEEVVRDSESMRRISETINLAQT
jgi:hypothetical protein